MLVETLILLFIIIIFYEICNDSFNYYEGFYTIKSKSTQTSTPTITTVTPTNNSNLNTNVSTPPATSNDSMILSQKNAGEILLLKDQYNSNNNSITNIKSYMTKLFDNVETLNDQIKAINGK